MQQSELDELMKASAGDAVATAREEFGLELNYSPESIILVDDLLLGFIDKYHDEVLEDQAVFTLCNIFGAYVGEVYKQLVGGEWRYDQSNPEAPHVLLAYANNTYAFAGICYERLVNDSQVSVKAYFDQACTHHKQ
ncbi:hypothetical protein DRW07_08815 [Alteromonas sediminis]|uniref:DUF3806 domain-containing protein n=1 Tax=Alteromonas sediminis TaxID=2259342 RepID=A0A3N5YP70_9ALTE|nr:hypothetical protein [Alteromonas sediminis]RPJ67601.1 hypothetical protein DRW07_08815 [Alteromonas sediminis]